jgi:hypothetical protein
VRGAAPDQDADLTAQRAVVDAFLAAAREGDFEALVTVLDPDVVFRADRGMLPAAARYPRRFAVPARSRRRSLRALRSRRSAAPRSSTAR